MDTKTNKRIECGICGASVSKASFIRHLKSKKCVNQKNKVISTIAEDFKIDESDELDDSEPIEMVISEMEKETELVNVSTAVEKIEMTIVERALEEQAKKKKKFINLFNSIWTEEENKRKLRRQQPQN